MALEHIGLQAILADEQFQQGLKRYADGVSRMETVTDRGASAMTKAWAVGGAAVAVGAAAVVAGAAAVVAISKQGLDALNDWGNQLDALGDVLGTTGEQSSTWAIAMKQVGLSVEEGAPALNFFVKQLDDVKAGMTGTAQAAGKGAPQFSPFQKALQSLGVSAFDAKGKLRPFDELMPDLMRAFQRMPDGVNKSALAMDLFGKNGTKFLDFLSQGEDGLAKATRLGKLYELTVSSEMVQATQDFQNALEVTNLGVRGFWVQIGSKVLPVATRFVNVLNDRLLPPLIAFAQKIAPKLGEVLGKGLILFEDLFDLLEGKGNMIPQLAGDLGAFAGALGLDEKAIASFVLSALNNLGQFKDWLVGFLPLLQSGDWGGVWERLVSGADKGWDLLQPILAQWGTQIWDWLEDAAAAAPGKAGELINGLVGFLVAHGPEAWGLATEWGSKLWDWLTDTALPALGGKGNELVAGVTQWVKDHGPEAWGLATEWGGHIWDWVTDAVTHAPENIFPLLQAAGSWLQTNWDSQVAPVLGEWGSKFWDWIFNPQTGALVTLGEKMLKLTEQFLAWTQSAEAQQQFNEIGYSAGTALVDAIAGFFESKEGEDAAGQAMLKFLFSLSRAQFNIEQGVRNIGFNIGKGLYDGIADAFEKYKPDIYKWLNDSADALMGNLNELAEKIVAALADALSKLRLPLPSFQMPSFQSSQLPTNTNAQQAAFLQMQAVPLSLVVKIGENEIQNAVVTWVSNEVQSQFNEASAALA